VRLVARVLTPDGPLATGRVAVLAPEGEREAVRIGEGKVSDGILAATADPGAVWALSIDDRAVVAFPMSSVNDVVDLGEIMMLREGIAWRAFHARDSRVYGIPRALFREEVATPPAGDPGTTPEPLPVRKRMTFGDMFGTTARQLAVAAAAETTNFAISAATITLKGVPSATENAISLEFPTAEVAATGAGLSELSFSIKPKADAPSPAAPPAEQPPQAAVPDLVGYTREFAIRKATSAGFVTEVSTVLVRDDSDTGRVVRHLPPPGAALTPGGLIRLYVGKTGAP